MFAAGTRVRLKAASGGYPVGTEGVVVYDLGDDVCQIALDSGEPLLVACSDLEPSLASVDLADDLLDVRLGDGQVDDAGVRGDVGGQIRG
jgi:hypothetical protein